MINIIVTVAVTVVRRCQLLQNVRRQHRSQRQDLFATPRCCCWCCCFLFVGRRRRVSSQGVHDSEMQLVVYSPMIERGLLTTTRVLSVCGSHLAFVCLRFALFCCDFVDFLLLIGFFPRDSIETRRRPRAAFFLSKMVHRERGRAGQHPAIKSKTRLQ